MPSTLDAGRGRRCAVRTSNLTRAVFALATMTGVLGGCSASPPPEPGVSRGVPPDLRGRRVILLPVQRVDGVAGDPDAELAFTLAEFGAEVDWVTEDQIQAALRRSPTVETRTRGLPVGVFMQAEVDRVGDPLYGYLRRMEALVEADAILLPVAATYEPDPRLPESGSRARLTAALVEPRTGRVIWFGIEQGGAFDSADPRALASAVEELARTLFWYAGR
jgi:hypothetical protein